MRRSASEVIRNLEMRVARLERSASTRKVAGHIVLAGNVNVRQLTRDLEDTFGVEDIELEDGVKMMSNVVDCDPESVTIGMEVEVVFEDATEEVTFAKFKPVQ